ncbi:hypothetical protein KAW18_15620 [candidate division WOR-3 bacterium]|nr:hypothetical protein [candidate division WOR-3 bacterium]
MRLFVNGFGSKFYIAAYACTRSELAQKISDQISIKIEDTWYDYDIVDVYAEPAGSFTTAGMIIGALIGLLGGPIGVILGGLFGYLFGMNEDAKEKRKVKIFNESYTKRGMNRGSSTKSSEDK